MEWERQGNLLVKKVDRLDAHDRYENVISKDFDIGACCEEMVKSEPFGSIPFYIFVHGRKDEDGSTTRLIWQPRLTRPLPQTNSMLFKGYPGTDIIKIIWMIPAREMWPQYEKGKITHSEIVLESIHNFVHNRGILEQKEEDDLSDEEIDAIYREVSKSCSKIEENYGYSV